MNVECLLPHMQSICEFMLTAQQDPDPDVSCFVHLLVCFRFGPPRTCVFLVYRVCLVLGAEEGEVHRQREDTCKKKMVLLLLEYLRPASRFFVAAFVEKHAIEMVLRRVCVFCLYIKPIFLLF